MSTALTEVSERRAALAKQHSDPPAQVTAKMPEIRLSVHMSKKAVPKGHFFIVDRNVGQDEDPIITDIGDEFECIVLRSCMKMSAFDSDNNQSLAESTEFSDFQNEPIFVIDNAGERPCIATVAPYTILKQMKYQPTKDELKAGKVPHPLLPILKDMKLQYIAYVLYKPEGADAPGLYLLKLGARGWLGMNAQGEACKYGEEADSSFLKVRAAAHKVYPRTTHMHVWRVFSSSFKTGEKDEDGKAIVDHYPSFGLSGEWPDEFLDTVEQSIAMLKDYLMSQYARRLTFAWRNTTDRDFIPGNVAAMLDSASGGDDVAQYLMGEKKLAAAAKTQLTIGAAPAAALPAAAPAAPRSRKSSKQEVEDVANELGGVAEEPEEPADAPAPKKSSTFQNLFGKGKQAAKSEQASIDEGVAAATGALEDTDERRKKDPELDKFMRDTEVEPQGKEEEAVATKGTPVSKIPKGW